MAMSETSSSSLLPLVVIGSVNVDVYVEVERLPVEGETIAARRGQTYPGGKGANQAACAARLSYPTFFCGQVGRDGHASLVKDALAAAGVRLDHVASVAGHVTGQAVVLLQPGGKNSIIIIGGANAAGWSATSDELRQLIMRAGALLLQREIPDAVNLEAAKIAKSADVPVIMDAGGAEGPLPEELLRCVTVLSPNETELARLTSMPTSSLQNILEAASKVQKMVWRDYNWFSMAPRMSVNQRRAILEVHEEEIICSKISIDLGIFISTCKDIPQSFGIRDDLRDRHLDVGPQILDECSDHKDVRLLNNSSYGTIVEIDREL